MVDLKSPVNRFGGKHLLSASLSQKIPKHVCYVEVFAGAGHLLFAKRPSQVEVINDTDSLLITFFNVLKSSRKRKYLIYLLDNMPYSRLLWQCIRRRFKIGDYPVNDIERAAQWYFLNRSTFSGDQLRGGFAVPSVTGRNPAQSFRTAIASFDDVAERLQNVTIECLDYADCIQRYDSKDTLFFCDPPYLNVEHYYSKDSFMHDDHYKLADLLHGVKAKVMITHYQNGLYDELYKDWQRYEYSSFKGSHKSDGEVKPKTTEVLYTNFDQPVKTKNLFQEVNS